MDQGILATIVVLVSIVLGFSFPDVGLAWKPFLPLLLAILMFFVTLGMQIEHVARSFRQYPALLSGLTAIFVLTPLIALTAKPLFPQITFTGVMLAFSCPCALVTSFWAKILNGDTATGLVLSAITNIMSIVTVPATLLLALGTSVIIDLNFMIINLAEVLLIPTLLSFGIRMLTKRNLTKVTSYTQNLQLVLLLLLIWGATSPGVSAALNSLTEFVSLATYMLVALAFAFVISYTLTLRIGKPQAITIGIASSIKNGALALVIGTATFQPAIVLPLVANLIAQTLLLVPLKLTVGRKAKTE